MHLRRTRENVVASLFKNKRWIKKLKSWYKPAGEESYVSPTKNSAGGSNWPSHKGNMVLSQKNLTSDKYSVTKANCKCMAKYKG